MASFEFFREATAVGREAAEAATSDVGGWDIVATPRGSAAADEDMADGEVATADGGQAATAARGAAATSPDEVKGEVKDEIKEEGGGGGQGGDVGKH